jgi:RimJ/RimL family protein N-acetyltransferase
MNAAGAEVRVEEPSEPYLRLPRVPPTVETARLRLRQLRESDLDDLARLSADPAFTRFLGGPRARTDSWRQLAMLIGHWQMRGYGWYAATLIGEDRLIGRIGHWYPLGWPGLEVGWALDPAVWGRGLAAEGARACLEIAHDCLGLSSVISLIDPSNRNSQRVAEKLGGRLDGRFELDGQPVDIWRTPTG